MTPGIATMSGFLDAATLSLEATAAALRAVQASVAGLVEQADRVASDPATSPRNGSAPSPDGPLRQLHDTVEALRASFTGQIQAGADTLAALQQAVATPPAHVAEQASRLDALNDRIAAGEAAASRQGAALAGRVDALEQAAASRRADEARESTRLFVAAAKEGTLLLRAGDLISTEIARTGIWDHHVIGVMDRVAQARQGTALDVGAHFGTLSIAMARRFARVISFEPNDFSYRLLRSNIALNGLTNIVAHNTPVFSAPVGLSLGKQDQQEIELPLGPDGTFDPLQTPNIASYMFTPDGGPEYRHQSVTLDSLDLDDVVFIKIDVQGADGEVIMGARQLIGRCRPVVVFEWEDHLSAQFHVSLADLREAFGQLGYTLEVLKVHNDKQVDYVAYPSVAEASPDQGRGGDPA